jgi:enoyl-CoA hydratase/carnithine racemase
MRVQNLFPGDVARPRLEEYADKYSHILAFERTDGILEARLHSNGGPMGSTGWFNVWHQAWAEIGNDPDNEIIIITATGDRWLDYSYSADWKITDALRQKLADRTSEEWMLQLYTYALKNTQNVIFALDVPTIGVIQANAFGHYEMALFCDITLCAEGIVFTDPHTATGIAPGDGLGLAFQHLMSPKQSAYYLYTGDTFDAETARELGLVNEVLPVENLMPRAREIAGKILKTPRLARLMTKQIVRRSAQRHHTEDASMHLAHELLGWCRNVQDGTASNPEQNRDALLAFDAAIKRQREERQ